MKLCLSLFSGLIAIWLISPVMVCAQRGRGRASHVMRGFEEVKPEIMPGRFELFQTCRTSFDCLIHIPYSQCEYETKVCSCQSYHVPYNNTICLPASLLGYGCKLDSQCRVKVENSRCIDGLCACETHFIPMRKDKCLPPSPVGSFCVNDLQCAYYSSYSYCRFIIPRVYGKCSCPLGYFLSEDGHCFPQLGSVCNSNEDCSIVTPNAVCAHSPPSGVCECEDGYVKSSNGLMCHDIAKPEVEVYPVSLGQKCINTQECQGRDPHSHCLDGICECLSPDDKCSAQKTGCFEDSFQCRNGYCISYFFVCDSQMNCADNSDEDQCIPFNCPKLAFQCDDGTCLPQSSVCNGHWECPDGSDEARCYTGIPCQKNAFRCKNGQCLPGYSFCNAYQDCRDGSDELEDTCVHGYNCTAPGHFECDNGQCRSSAILCSGVDGCGDNSDETKCEVCYCKMP